MRPGVDGDLVMMWGRRRRLVVDRVIGVLCARPLLFELDRWDVRDRLEQVPAMMLNGLVWWARAPGAVRATDRHSAEAA